MEKLRDGRRFCEENGVSKDVPGVKSPQLIESGLCEARRLTQLSSTDCT